MTSASSSPRASSSRCSGPSGCGKTTTLRMIGGFEQPTEGTVRIDGDDVSALPPHKRPTNTVFQSYALFPHMSVEDNVAFGLRRKRVGKEEIARTGRGRAEAGRPRGRGEPAAGAALGRPAAARRAGAGAGQPAEGPAARRAARRPRPETAQGAPGRAEADPARRRDHLRLRHPRPGGGADDERPDRGDEPRPGRAGRRPRDVYDQPATTFVAGFIGVSNLMPAKVTGDGEIRLDQGPTAERRDLVAAARRALPRGGQAREAADRRPRRGRLLERAADGSRGRSKARSTSARRPRSRSTSATACG